MKAFREIARSLRGYTEKVVISFVDFYAKMQRNMKGLNIRELSREEMTDIAKKMAGIAAENGMVIETCAERIDLREVGIRHGSCIDKGQIEKITGYTLNLQKDKNQREECGCFESIDVGTYHTCKNGCRYCYANDSMEKVRACAGLYDVDSPLLCGRIGSEDKVTERKVRSCRETQMNLFGSEQMLYTVKSV